MKVETSTTHSFTDRFIHKDILANENISAQARMVSSILQINSIGLIIASISFFWARDFHTAYQIAFVFTSTMSIAFLLCIAIIWKLGLFETGASLTVLVHIAVIVSGIFLTGGPTHSPFSIILLLMPILSFLLINKRAGVASIILVLFAQLSMFIAEMLGYRFPLVDLPIDLAVIENWCWILAYILMCQFVFVYEFNNSKLKNELQEKKDLFEHMACHDPLTGLDNRRLFFDKLDKALFRADRHNSLFALLYIDLDGFKPINDSYGHTIGDKVLEKLAQRLSDNLRKIDTIARIGGDEFGILLEDLQQSKEVLSLCEKIARVIAQPMLIGELNLSVRSSIGVAIYPDDSKDMEELTRLADDAMYKAKAQKAKNNREKTASLGQAYFITHDEFIQFKS